MAQIKIEIKKEIVVELNEEFFNEDFNEHYSRYFSDTDTLEGHAENIAYQYNSFGHTHLEGYGKPLVNGDKHWSDRSDPTVVYNEAINIIDDEDTELYAYEI